MTSFVREVLTYTGSLGNKEDFSSKIVKIQKKLGELKLQLQIEVEAKYVNFAASLNNTEAILSHMERLNSEIELLDETMNKQYKTNLAGCEKEQAELTDALTELKLTGKKIEKLKECYDLVEESGRLLYEGKWFRSSQLQHEALQMLRSRYTQSDESYIKVIPIFKKELTYLMQRTHSKLQQIWISTVVFTISQEKDKSGSATTNTVTLTIGGGNKFTDDKTGIEMKDLLQALYYCEILDGLLSQFADKLKRDLVEVLLEKSCSIVVRSNSWSLAWKEGTEAKAPPAQVFDQLTQLFRFLHIHLGCPVNQDNDVILMSLLGNKINHWLCDSLIRQTLAPAVPSSVDELASYDVVIEKTECFHSDLKNMGVLTSDSASILDYTKNVNNHYVTKFSQELLVSARDIMKADLFRTAEIEAVNVEPLCAEGSAVKDGNEPCQRSEQSNDEDDLPIPANFPLPDNAFQFPSCTVSQSAIDVLDVAKRGLNEAAAAKSDCAIKLFNVVRKIFEMWCAVVPTYHRAKLETLPQVAAIAHNSCFYLAHHLLTLGFLYQEKLGEAMAAHNITFVDLVPRLRQTGESVLLDCLKIQSEQVTKTLANAGFSSSGSDRGLYSGVEQGVKQVLHQLCHLQKVWQPVLPSHVYFRCIGTLLNTGLEEIVQKVVNLPDISADAAAQFSTLLGQIKTRCPQQLFKGGEDPAHYANKWNKFCELLIVLDASLREIEERWGGGGGKLAAEFPAEEVKMLIRAIFQNTERRAAVLAKIK